MNNFYNEEAINFFQGTVNADMQENYKDFLSLLTSGSRILDLGCGSGRDSLNFKNMGFQVTAIDSSEELAKMATNHIGQEVLLMDMRDLNFHEKFDGIWACASILHIPSDDIPKVFKNCALALKKDGIFYSSFKYGDFEGERNGRYFTDLNEDKFLNILKRVPELSILNTFITQDVRPERQELWFNVLLKKSN